jgi:hypothetical protein
VKHLFAGYSSASLSDAMSPIEIVGLVEDVTRDVTIVVTSPPLGVSGGTRHSFSCAEYPLRTTTPSTAGLSYAASVTPFGGLGT